MQLGILFNLGTTEDLFVPEEIFDFANEFYQNEQIDFVAMSSYQNSRWIMAISAKGSTLKLLIKYGSIDDEGLAREARAYENFILDGISPPLLASFATSHYRVLVFEYFPTSPSDRASTLELMDLAKRIQAIGIRHNDLAPWNTVRKEEKLFVIDWEDYSEDSSLSEIKGLETQKKYSLYLACSLIASSIGNFALMLLVSRIEASELEFGLLTAIFICYVFFLGTSRSLTTETDLALALNRQSSPISSARTRMVGLFSALLLLHLLLNLVLSGYNTTMAIAVLLLAGPIILDYFRYQLLRDFKSKSVFGLDLLWTSCFGIAIAIIEFSNLDLSPIQFFIVWEVTALLASISALREKSVRLLFEKFTIREVHLRERKSAQKARLISFLDYLAIYGLPLVFVLLLLNVVNGYLAFGYRISTMLLAFLPIMAQIALFSTRNVWIKAAMGIVHKDQTEHSTTKMFKALFASIGLLVCILVLAFPVNQVFPVLTQINQGSFQLMVVFVFANFLFIYLSTEDRLKVRYFAKSEYYLLGILIYVSLYIVSSLACYFRKDLILWTFLNSLLNLVFVPIWRNLYRKALKSQE
jgi:hypothetical protein